MLCIQGSLCSLSVVMYSFPQSKGNEECYFSMQCVGLRDMAALKCLKTET